MWINHKAGQITASIAREVYKTKVDITIQSLLKTIMQYTEVTKHRYTRFGTNTEPLAQEYYKNTQNLHHKNLMVKQCAFLVKQTHPQLSASSDGIVSCTYHNGHVFEIKCPHDYQNELKQ